MPSLPPSLFRFVFLLLSLTLPVASEWCVCKPPEHSVDHWLCKTERQGFGFRGVGSCTKTCAIMIETTVKVDSVDAPPLLQEGCPDQVTINAMPASNAQDACKAA